MLEVRDLRGGYGGAEVLRGVALTVERRRGRRRLGSNGAGKTTLNRALSGLLPQCSGEIRFAGRRIDGARSPAIVAAGLIHVPEGRKIFPNMSVQENLELGSYRRGRSRRGANLERVFAAFPRLSERARPDGRDALGGEQQMLAIGRGLMAEPRLLILDEPSLGLSPLLVEEMFGSSAASTPTGSRSSWSSRTWCSRSKWRRGPTSWRMACSPSRGRQPSSGPTRRSSKPISACEVLMNLKERLSREPGRRRARRLRRLDGCARGRGGNSMRSTSPAPRSPTRVSDAPTSGSFR